ncbi:ABC transporter substrate-binding protein [Acidisoma sp. 7E03]
MATPALASAAFPVTVTDITGTRVMVDRAPRRILLGDSLLFTALSLIDPEVADRLVMTSAFVKRWEPGYFGELTRLYPKLAAVPVIGDLDTAGLERALVAAPDLVILSLWQKSSVQPALAQFAALGIPVLFVDTYLDPLKNGDAAMRLLGRVLGQAAAADAFADFHAEKLALLTRLSGATPPVSVLLQVYPGIMTCCWDPGRSGFGSYLPIAGGRSIGTGKTPGTYGGTLALDYVMAADPRFYVGTGLSDPQEKGLCIGFGIDRATAQASLRRVLANPDLAAIPAVQAGRAYAIWNFFNGSPLNILAMEAMAGWFHPEAAQAAGVNPEASFDIIRSRFLKRDLIGTLWLGPEDAA